MEPAAPRVSGRIAADEASAASKRELGQMVGGKYRLDKILGAGGMGEVWKATHTSLQTAVALKFLKGSWAFEPLTRSRFELEARVTAQLKTRLAVQVFDYGVAEDGQPFLVMELLDGESLAARLDREKRLSPAETLGLLGQAAKALERAHALGIVHRDFKPGNIFLVFDEDRREVVKVMDFGLAKIVGELELRSAAQAPELDHSSPSTFTRTGALLGTPSYMSPEQVAGQTDIGPATDIWALGVVVYECLTGVTPFVGKNLPELFDRIMALDYQRPTLVVPDLPRKVDAWFETALAKEGSRRPSSPIAALLGLAEAFGLPPPAGFRTSGEWSGPRPAAADLSSGPVAPGSATVAEGSAPTISRPKTYKGSRAGGTWLRSRPKVAWAATAALAASAAYGAWRLTHASRTPVVTTVAAPAVTPPPTVSPIPSVPKASQPEEVKAAVAPPASLTVVQPPAPKETVKRATKKRTAATTAKSPQPAPPEAEAKAAGGPAKDEPRPKSKPEADSPWKMPELGLDDKK